MVAKSSSTPWRAAVTALVICVACAFEFGLAASAGIIPKHFDAPTSMAFIGDHAFVTDGDTDTITLFNAVTEHFEHVPPTWFRLRAPQQVVAFGQYVWVSNGVPGTLSEFGPNGSRFVRTVNPNQQQTLVGNLVNADGSLWYLARTSNSIFQLNGTTGDVINQIKISSDEISNPDVMAFIDGNIWVSSYFSNTLAEINAASGQFIQKVMAPYEIETTSLAVNGNDLWISSNTGLSEIDGLTGVPLFSISASNNYLTGVTAVASGGGDIWIVSAQRDSLAELNASNGKLVRVITRREGGLSWPCDVVYRHGDVWVVNQNNNSVSEIDAATGKLVRNLR
jgi:hypothetical protein